MGFKLPSRFLQQQGPKVTVERVDFESVGLPEYKNYYAVVLDNVLSNEECDQILAAAEATTEGQWERAMVNTGGNTQALILDVRNCGRIIWDDSDVVERVWSRVAPHVPEVQVVTNNAHVTGHGPVKRKETMLASRLNERMRFLKYTGGEYFHIHCDGCYATPGYEERSLYTLHLYLNERGPDNNLIGGATTFHSLHTNSSGVQKEYNVYPKTGRVLLFQQRNLPHSGQGVDEGVKYTMRTDLMFKTQENTG